MAADSEADSTPLPTTRALVQQVRAAVRTSSRPKAIAAAVSAALEGHLPAPTILTPAQRQGDPRAYQQHVLHVEPDGTFSIVALVWRPGQSTAIHDHLCWCVVGVMQGVELEARYEITDPHRREATQVAAAVNRAGSVCGMAPPGDVHRVTADGQTTISLHVYGTDIIRAGSSIRRCYVPARSR